MMRCSPSSTPLDAGPELFDDVLAEDGHELVDWDIRTQRHAAAATSTP